MTDKTYSQFLRDRNFSNKKVELYSAFTLIFEEAFSKSSYSERVTFFPSFSSKMIKDGTNTEDNYYALALYGRFLEDNALVLVSLELIDGGEVLSNLYRITAERLGTARRNQLFAGLEVIPLGTPNNQKPAAMHAFLSRLLADEPEVCKTILSDGLRDLGEGDPQVERKLFVECGDIDTYLIRKKMDNLDLLEKIMNENRLFFNQRITPAVLDFVRSNPEVMGGIRHGNIIYETKIPYSTIEYLEESDPEKKRYLYCHCPWVKASLEHGKSEISSVFCNCSAAFHKKSWEVLFGQKLEAEVLKSVLNGDEHCRFAIHLPENLTPPLPEN